eukprot:6333810-Pyramimonas_sp.AAC.1
MPLLLASGSSGTTSPCLCPRCGGRKYASTEDCAKPVYVDCARIESPSLARFREQNRAEDKRRGGDCVLCLYTNRHLNYIKEVA